MNNQIPRLKHIIDLKEQMIDAVRIHIGANVNNSNFSKSDFEIFLGQCVREILEAAQIDDCGGCLLCQS